MRDSAGCLESPMVSSALSAEIAAAAARLVVEEGMEYGPAKRRAAKLLGKWRGRQELRP